METLKWVSLKRQIFLFIDNYYYYYAGKLVIFLLQNVVRIHCKAELSIVLHATQKKRYSSPWIFFFCSSYVSHGYVYNVCIEEKMFLLLFQSLEKINVC